MDSIFPQPVTVQSTGTDPETRYQTLISILQCPESDSRWISKVLKATADPYEPVRVAAANALENLDAPNPGDLQEILACMQRPADSEVVYWAVTLIGRMGSAAANVAGTLGNVLSDSPFLHVRERAAWALSQMGPAAIIAEKPLSKAAQKGSPRLKRLAQRALDGLLNADAA